MFFTLPRHGGQSSWHVFGGLDEYKGDYHETNDCVHIVVFWDHIPHASNWSLRNKRKEKQIDNKELDIFMEYKPVKTRYSENSKIYLSSHRKYYDLITINLKISSFSKYIKCDFVSILIQLFTAFRHQVRKKSWFKLDKKIYVVQSVFERQENIFFLLKNFFLKIISICILVLGTNHWDRCI